MLPSPHSYDTGVYSGETWGPKNQTIPRLLFELVVTSCHTSRVGHVSIFVAIAICNQGGARTLPRLALVVTPKHLDHMFQNAPLLQSDQWGYLPSQTDPHRRIEQTALCAARLFGWRIL
jgi:hypothetical protein